MDSGDHTYHHHGPGTATGQRRDHRGGERHRAARRRLALDDMSIDGAAFVIAVAIFTGVVAVTQPLITQTALRNARALAGSSALLATLVGLIVTAWVSDGLTISGATTWVLATVIVWAA